MRPLIGILGAMLLIALHAGAHAQVTTTSCTRFANQLNCTHKTPDDALVRLGAASLHAIAIQRAAETQAAWTAAGRQAEQAALTARERAAQTAAAIPELVQLALSAPPTLQPVNTELVTDWSAMDGVTTFSEYKLEGGVRRRLTVRFALNPTPDGSQFVQLRMDSRLLVTQGFRQKPVAFEVLDGRYDLATGVTLLTSSREAMRPDVAPLYESVVLIGEHGFMAKMGGVTQGKVPSGTVPSSVLSFVVAAIPGNLPDSISLWVLDWDTANVILAHLTLQKRATRRIPVARDGVACEERVVTSYQHFPVLVYKVRIGTREETKTFLERVPHLPIAEETRCIDLVR